MSTKALLRSGKPARAQLPKLPERFTYALTPWTVQIRADGWHACESFAPYYGEVPRWIGPYPDISSVTLAIASKLRSEAVQRHKRQVVHYRLPRSALLFGLARAPKQ